jgi:hypothetical protein
MCFLHRYGDCKDKTTLMASMLHEIGVESYFVVINSERGSVTPDMPAHLGGFDHMILAVKLPDGLTNPQLIAILQHPRLGKLLFFDPTNELTPFGQVGGIFRPITACWLRQTVANWWKYRGNRWR